MIIIKNYNLMREISAGVNKANKLLDKAKKAATKYEERSFGKDLIKSAQTVCVVFKNTFHPFREMTLDIR